MTILLKRWLLLLMILHDSVATAAQLRTDGEILERLVTCGLIQCIYPKSCMLCTVKNCKCPFFCVALAPSQCQVLSYREKRQHRWRKLVFITVPMVFPSSRITVRQTICFPDSLSKCLL